MASPGKSIAASLFAIAIICACAVAAYTYANRPRPTNADVEKEFAVLAPGTPLTDCKSWLDSRNIGYHYEVENISPSSSDYFDSEIDWFKSKKYKASGLGGIVNASIKVKGFGGPGCGDAGQQLIYLFFNRHYKLICDHVVWAGDCL